mgnify:CR=1 FL=1
MMGELLDADVVSYTNYDGGQAVSSSLRIALRVMRSRNTPKSVLLVPSTMNPEIFARPGNTAAAKEGLIRWPMSVKPGLWILRIWRSG